MMRVARPTTITDKALNRIILIAGLGLLIGIPAFVAFYAMDRHVDPGARMADRTVTEAEAAVQADPRSLAARDHLAAAYVSADRFADGVTQFTEALKIDSKDRAALLGRGIAYYQLKQYDPAAADLQTFISGNAAGEFAKQDPQLEQAYYELGAIQVEQGRNTDAVVTLEKALKINASDADALYSLGVALTKTGDPAKGVLALKQAVAFVPTDWCDPYAALVPAYQALGNADGVAYANGMVTFCNGNYAAAATALKPLTSGTMATDALIGLALTSAKSGDNDAARAYYQQVLAKDPGNQSAIIGLSSMVGGTSSAAPSPSGSK